MTNTDLLKNTFNRATKFWLENFGMMIKVVLPSLFLMIISIAFDFSTGDQAAWLKENNLGIIFFSIIYVLRIFAYTYAFIGIAWLAGSGLFGEKITLKEIYTSSARPALTAVFTILPLWFVTAFFANIAMGMFQLIHLSFSGLNFVFFVYISLFGILFVIMTVIMAKFINVIPILAFERKPALWSLVQATKHLKYKPFFKAGLKPFAVVGLFVIVVMIPSWSFCLPIWNLTSATQNFIIQACSVSFSMFLMPIGVVYITAIYFGRELSEQFD